MIVIGKYYVIESVYPDKGIPRIEYLGRYEFNKKPKDIIEHTDDYDYYKEYIGRREEVSSYLYFGTRKKFNVIGREEFLKSLKS